MAPGLTLIPDCRWHWSSKFLFSRTSTSDCSSNRNRIPTVPWLFGTPVLRVLAMIYHVVISYFNYYTYVWSIFLKLRGCNHTVYSHSPGHSRVKTFGLKIIVLITCSSDLECIGAIIYLAILNKHFFQFKTLLFLTCTTAFLKSQKMFAFMSSFACFIK